MKVDGRIKDTMEVTMVTDGEKSAMHSFCASATSVSLETVTLVILKSKLTLLILKSFIKIGFFS